MSRRGVLRFDEATYNALAAKRERWQNGTYIENAQPVELVRTERGVEPVPVKQPARRMGKVAHEQPYFWELMKFLRPYGIAEPKCEFRFDLVRRWRFDFAWPIEKIAIEIDGGLFINGAHNRGAALLEQYEKGNAATVAGWRVLRYGPKQIGLAARDVLQILNR